MEGDGGEDEEEERTERVPAGTMGTAAVRREVTERLGAAGVGRGRGGGGGEIWDRGVEKSEWREWRGEVEREWRGEERRGEERRMG